MSRRNHFKSATQRNYRLRKKDNPYFQKRRSIPFKPLLAIVGCCVLVGFGIIAMFSSKRFEIQNIEITGIEHIDVNEIENLVCSYLESSSLLFWKKSNVFLFDASELSEAISTQFTFADVQTSTSGQNLYLSITERTSNLLWQVGDDYYVVDLEGVVVRQLSQQEIDLIHNSENTGELIEDLPIFLDKNNIPISVGDSVLTESEIQGTFQFHQYLLGQSLSCTQTVFDRLAGKWVSVDTDKGFQILFDPTGDVEQQAARLKVLMEKEIQESESLEYIDLRFGDHVYYQ